MTTPQALEEEARKSDLKIPPVQSDTPSKMKKISRKLRKGMITKYLLCRSIHLLMKTRMKALLSIIKYEVLRIPLR